MGNDDHSSNNESDHNKAERVSERVAYRLHLNNIMKEFELTRHQRMKDFEDARIQTMNEFNTARLEFERKVREMEATAI